MPGRHSYSLGRQDQEDEGSEELPQGHIRRVDDGNMPPSYQSAVRRNSREPAESVMETNIDDVSDGNSQAGPSSRSEDRNSDSAPPSYKEALTRYPRGDAPLAGLEGLDDDDDSNERLNTQRGTSPQGEGEVVGEDDGLNDNERRVNSRMRRAVSELRRSQSTLAGEEAFELEMPSESTRPNSTEMDPEMETDVDDDDNITPRAALEIEFAPGHVAEENHRNVDERDAELGRQSSSSSTEYDCETFPFLNPLINALARTSRTRKILIAVGVVVILGLLLLVSLLPASYVYISYHQMGFSRNKITGAHDYSRVYDSGCYLLAPQDEIVTFPVTGLTLDLNVRVMNAAGMTIGLALTFQYFLRPEELHLLFQKYHFDYHDVIYSVSESHVKNMAVDFTMDEYRLNRSFVEAQLFNTVRQVLSDYHVDVHYFQLGRIIIPDELMNRFMKQAVLEMELETEKHRQDAAVERIKTQQEVQMVLNDAHEIREAAEAKSVVIDAKAKALKEKEVQTTYIDSLKKLFSHLNLTTEESQTSFMFMKALKDVRHNLYAFSYDYASRTLMTP